MIARVGVLILVFTSFSMAQRYHLTYAAGHFSGDSSDVYSNFGYSLSNSGLRSWLFAPVVFPDSANGMQVTRLSYSLLDNSVTGYIAVSLEKVDRWTGIATTVGFLASDYSGASNSIAYLNKPKSSMNGRGIDNNRWAWYLMAYFSEGDTPLNLYHVTIRYE